MRLSIRSRTCVAAAFALAAAATIGPIATAGAAPKPVLQLDGGTSYTLNAGGDAVVTGPVEVTFRRGDEFLPATITATLKPLDGTLPEPETCEPARARFVVSSAPGRTGMRLVGKGEVCGEFPQPPTSVVTHVFTGRYKVAQAQRGALVGTDGFFEIRLGTDNVASAFAIDT